MSEVTFNKEIGSSDVLGGGDKFPFKIINPKSPTTTDIWDDDVTMITLFRYFRAGVYLNYNGRIKVGDLLMKSNYEVESFINTYSFRVVRFIFHRVRWASFWERYISSIRIATEELEEKGRMLDILHGKKRNLMWNYER